MKRWKGCPGGGHIKGKGWEAGHGLVSTRAAKSGFAGKAHGLIQKLRGLVLIEWFSLKYSLFLNLKSFISKGNFMV